MNNSNVKSLLRTLQELHLDWMAEEIESCIHAGKKETISSQSAKNENRKNMDIAYGPCLC